MDVRVEGHEVAKCLHVQDESRLAVRLYGLEACLQQSGDDLAQAAEVSAPIAKERPNQLRQREHVLPMRYRGEDVSLEPLTVSEHPFLMTARAEVPGLAGVGQQVVPAALVAVEAGKAMMQIATG